MCGKTSIINLKYTSLLFMVYSGIIPASNCFCSYMHRPWIKKYSIRAPPTLCALNPFHCLAEVLWTVARPRIPIGVCVSGCILSRIRLDCARSMGPINPVLAIRYCLDQKAHALPDTADCKSVHLVRRVPVQYKTVHYDITCSQQMEDFWSPPWNNLCKSYCVEKLVNALGLSVSLFQWFSDKKTDIPLKRCKMWPQ